MQRLKQTPPGWPSIPSFAVMPGRGLVPGGHSPLRVELGAVRGLNSLVRSILCRMVYKAGALKLSSRYVVVAKESAYILR